MKAEKQCHKLNEEEKIKPESGDAASLMLQENRLTMKD